MRFGKCGDSDCAVELCKILNDSGKAVLFVDSVTSELLHWWVGEGKWICGVERILDLEDKNVVHKAKVIGNAEKVVFLSGSLLRGDRLQLIQHLLAQVCSSSVSCTSSSVYSTLPAGSHAGVVAGYSRESDEESPFSVLARQLKRIMLKSSNGRKCTVGVHHLPALIAPVSSHVFFTPGHTSLQSLLPTDVARINSHLTSQRDQRQASSLATVDINMLPDTVRQHLKCFCHSFSELFGDLGVQEHCFSLGPTSRLVAAELAALPEARARHKVATSSASVLFVDRSLDLATPLSCNPETLADSIRCTLPALPGHTADVAVDMSSLLDVHSSCRHCIAPGCLAHPSNSPSQTLLSSFVNRKTKDALTELSRRMVEAISAEKLPVDARRMSAITPSVLRGLLAKFKCQSGAIARNSALLQLAMAATTAMESKATVELQRTLSVEKVVLLTLSEEGFTPALEQLVSHMKKAMEGVDGLDASGYLRLLVILFSAAGDVVLEMSAGTQTQLQTGVEGIIEYACNKNEEFVTKLIGEKHNSDSIRVFVRTLISQLLGIAKSRSHLKMFKAINSSTSGPLLQQVAEALASPDKPDLPDVEYHSQYMRNLLKTGFSLFMGGSKPRPTDHPLLIVFVLGGVTCTEAKTIRDQFASARSSVEVIVGSTALLTAKSLLHQVCCEDSLYDVHI